MRKKSKREEELFRDYYDAYMEYIRPYTDGNIDYTDYEEPQIQYEMISPAIPLSLDDELTIEEYIENQG